MSEHLLQDLENIHTISQVTPDVLEIFDITDIPFSMRATMSLPISVSYVLKNDKIYTWFAGEIAWIDIEPAQQILIDHPYIEQADIKIIPFWSGSLPREIDNISFKVAK